jgi:RNA polymerase sigma-70 factor (ECF subfamily)
MTDDRSAMHTRPSLLVRVRDAADAGAWATFVDIYAPLVYGLGRRRGLQDADAADLTQDVMGEVIRSIRAFEYQPARGRFRDWLLLIARRRLCRFFDRRARRGEEHGQADALDQAEDRTPDADWNDAFSARVLEVALQRIQPDFEPATWRAFERVWLENRPAPETAAELSMKIQLVYKAKSRVLKRLTEEVEEINEDFSWLDAIEASPKGPGGPGTRVQTGH